MPNEGPTETTEKKQPRRPKQVVGYMLVVLALAATPLVAGLVRGDEPAPTKKVVSAADTEKAPKTPKAKEDPPAKKQPAKKFPPKPKPCKPKGSYKQRPRLPKNCRRVKP